MNLPNKLTIIRMCLVPVFIFFALLNTTYIGLHFPGRDLFAPYSWLIAGIIFVVAALTDYLDGAIARKHNLVTDFGKFMDPLADKFMVVSALIVLIPLVPPTVVILIIAREFAVNGIRMLAASSDGNVIAANWWGKVKTVVQIIAIICAFIYKQFEPYFYYNITPKLIIFGLFWAVGIFTAISGIVYIMQNKQYINYKK